MALTSTIYDHFIIWPSSVTLTFNLRKQMFRTSLLLFEDNNCAKLIWNPCLNAPVMARTSSLYDHFDLYLTPMTLTFSLPEQMFQMALLFLEGNNCKIILKSMHKCTGYGPDKLNTCSIWPFDLIWPLWPWPSTYLKMFQMAVLLLKGNNCAKLFWNPCIIVQVMVRTNADGRTDARTYTEQKL